MTTCLPVNMCAGSRERINVFQITVLETLTDAIPRLLQKFNVFIRKLGDFIRDLVSKSIFTIHYAEHFSKSYGEI